jgi:hypothetical protein
MLDTFQGLPVHALIVHATVVMLPTAAVLVALASCSPRFRTWIGPVPAIAAVISVILVPLTTSSGDKLQDVVDAPGTCKGLHDAIEHHQELADWLIWLVVPLALVAILSYVLHRRGTPSKTVVIVLAVVSLFFGASVLVQTARVGHAGAEAVWKGCSA